LTFGPIKTIVSSGTKCSPVIFNLVPPASDPTAAEPSAAVTLVTSVM